MSNRAEDEAIRRLDFVRQVERGQTQIGVYVTRLVESLTDKERAILRKRLGTMPLEPSDRRALEELIGKEGTTDESHDHPNLPIQQAALEQDQGQGLAQAAPESRRRHRRKWLLARKAD
jgi:hypothetical protein